METTIPPDDVGDSNRRECDSGGPSSPSIIRNDDPFISDSIDTTKGSSDSTDKTRRSSDSTDTIASDDESPRNSVRNNNIERRSDQWETSDRPVVQLPYRKYESLPIIGGERKNSLTCRLSLRLPSGYNRSVPSANSHKQYDKAGCLHKLCGRGFPYLHHWKRRHCILSRGFLYVYENEDSKGNSKNSCVIDLKYFDHVIQASQKETKKATNVFIVTSQDKNLMDHHGRYTFSADTLTEMHDWMNRLKDTIDQIRNNNRASSTTRKNQNQIAKETPPTSPEQRRPSDTPDISAERLREEVQKALNEKTFSKLSREIATVPTAVVEKEEKSVPNVKVTSQKIFLEKADLTTLESMTKCRVKGPSGRRAPQFRKTVSKNLRAASSMTALQQNSSLEDGSRNIYQFNYSDLEEEEDETSPLEDVNCAHPISAYHYSSDEESIPSSVSPCNVVRDVRQRGEEFTPPINSKLTSMDALRTMRGSRTNPLTRRGSPPLPEHNRNEDLLEYRSLPKSLRKKNGIPHIKGDTLLMKLPTYETYSSSVKLSSGRASPEMDALDNLLMSQSVCTSTSCHNAAPSDEGSDGSTCKHQEEVNKGDEQFMKALENCSGIIQQLQHHSTDLELRTNRIENELSLSSKDISSLYETSAGLKNDIEKLAKAVSIISEEASVTHKETSSQRKESERIHKTTLSALKEAKQAYLECENAKSNYESLIRELHSLITSIRSSLVVTEEEESLPEKQPEITTKQSPSKSSNKESTKSTGYQSFFQRPSSLIYTLTNRSANKSTSCIDSKSKDRETKKEKEEAKCKLNNLETKKEETRNKQSHNWDTKKEKEEVRNNWERNNSKPRSCQNSLERKSRSSSKIDSLQGNMLLSVNADPLKASRSRETSRSRDRISKLISGRSENTSFEDIPMMDEFNDSRDPHKKFNVTKGISHVTINVSPPSKLEKSVSSPVLTYDKKANRPKYLQMTEDRFGSRINKLSPELPVNNFIPFENYDQNSEFQFLPDGSAFLSKHLNVVRQSSMSSVPEDLPLPSSTSRQGTFAISRQVSSPNISLQRPNSATLFPLQRQHSLGTVPEEGTLPRQASLMSVPEDRPIVDQTLPLSPSPSLISFPLSRTSSVADTPRSSRHSMELLTGPVISGSLIQESFIRSLPPSLEFEDSLNAPMATSSLRRHNESKRNSKIVHV